MSMEILLFQSDGVPDDQIIGMLQTLRIQRQRWIGAYHPESRIRRLAFQTSGMKIGAGTHFAIGTVVIDDYKNNVSIGERCSIGANVIFMSATSPDNSVLYDHPDLQRAIKTEPIVIGNDCWIGSGSIFMPGITVGDKAVVGAGAVITKDIAPLEVVQGIPGRVVRTL